MYRVFVLAVLFPSAAWAEGYEEVSFQPLLCVSSMSTGFKFQNSRWRSTSFKETKFVVKKGRLSKSSDKWAEKREEKKLHYEMSDFGDDDEELCYRGKTSVWELVEKHGFGSEKSKKWSNTLKCGHEFSQTIIDIKHKRYARTYLYGYIQPGTEDGNTPYIEFGDCEEIGG